MKLEEVLDFWHDKKQFKYSGKIITAQARFTQRMGADNRIAFLISNFDTQEQTT